MLSGEGSVWPVPAEQKPGGATNTKVAISTNNCQCHIIRPKSNIVDHIRSARARMPPGSRGGTPLTHYSTSPQPSNDPERY